MKKGLVLCGGGSKGSYEMGVWTALEELNEKFSIVTGTSIGCLNGAMYTQHGYEKCLELWNKIEIGMIMESGFNFENNSIRNELKKKTDMLSFFRKYVTNMGTDIKPFMKLMDEYIDCDAIINSDITFGICCAKFPSMKGFEYVIKKDMDKSLIKKYILASASCFPIFPVCKIGKESYVDGGYYDNLPINFAIDLGATDIVVVDLNPNLTHKEFLGKPYIRYIHPTRSLGSFMLFDRQVIQNNMTMGYNDTMKSYGKYIGFRYTFYNTKLEINDIRGYILEVTKAVVYIRQNKLKTLVKPEREGDLFYILERYTDSNALTDFDYFLRSLEVSAEIFNIEAFSVYHIDQFAKKIINEIISTETDENLLDGYSVLSPSKKKDYMSKLDDRTLLRYLADHVFGNIEVDFDFVINLVLTKPKVYIAYTLLKAMLSYLGDFL